MKASEAAMSKRAVFKFRLYVAEGTQNSARAVVNLGAFNPLVGGNPTGPVRRGEIQARALPGRRAPGRFLRG